MAHRHQVGLVSSTAIALLVPAALGRPVACGAAAGFPYYRVHFGRGELTTTTIAGLTLTTPTIASILSSRDAHTAVDDRHYRESAGSNTLSGTLTVSGT